MEISDFSLPYMNGGRAWLQPIGQEYELEEVHILRRAHVALHPNITRLEHHNDLFRDFWIQTPSPRIRLSPQVFITELTKVT